MVVNPLSFSCFSNTFRQPPHPTSSQLRGQADAAGPAESDRLCPGFPHGRRRRVTTGPRKFGVYFLSHLPLPHLYWTSGTLWLPPPAHAHTHYSGYQNSIKGRHLSVWSVDCHTLISLSQIEARLGEGWTPSSALSDDIKMSWLHTTGVYVLRWAFPIFWCQTPLPTVSVKWM